MQALGLFLAVVAVFTLGVSLRRRRGAALLTTIQNQIKPRAALAESPVAVNVGGPAKPEDDGILDPVAGAATTTVSLLTTVTPPAPAAPIVAPVTPAAPIVAPVTPAAPIVAPVTPSVPSTAPIAPAPSVSSIPSMPSKSTKAAPAARTKGTKAPAATTRATSGATSKSAPAVPTKAAPATATKSAPATATKVAPATAKTTARQTATSTARPAAKTTTARPKATTTRPPAAAAARPRKTTKSAPAPSCVASVDDRTPGSVVVSVASNVPATPFTVTAHYRSKKTVLSGVTDGAGIGSVTFDIGAATKGYKVKVDVNVSGKATCGTEFTPR